MPNSANGSIACGSEIVDVIKPRIEVHQRAEPVRPGEHADEDEPDHRVDAEAREGGDDDPGGAEDDERVGEGRGSGQAGHARNSRGFARGLPPLPRRCRSGRGGSAQPAAIAVSRFSTTFWKNCSVVIQGWCGPIRIARSLVMLPCSTVSMQTRSSVSANFVTSGVPSNWPRN